MTVRQIPTIPGRRLAIELRALREASVKSAEDAANELSGNGGRWSKSKIVRIEGAQLVPSVRDTNEMLDLYGVDDPEKRDAIIELARNGKMTRGWWLEYRDVLRGGYIAFEAGASSLRGFESAFVPGILQTPGYHRAFWEDQGRMGLTQDDPEQIERKIQVRQERKQVLERPDPLHVWVVIDESALRRLLAWPATAREQLDYLREQGTRRHINIQVLPLSAGANPTLLQPFTLLDFPDPHDPPLVYTEGSIRFGAQIIDDADWVASFAVRFEYLQARALGVPESRDFIEEIRSQVDQREEVSGWPTTA